MTEWKYISHKLLALVAPDGEVLDEIYGDHSGHRWTVSSTKKTYYGEQAAKAAAEKRALNADCGTSKTEHKWVCSKCKVDRLEEDCKGDRMRCPMVGEAYGAIRALGGDDE